MGGNGLCRGGRIHTQWGCRELLYKERSDGETEMTGLRLTRAGKEHIAKADVYVAALDVPGRHQVQHAACLVLLWVNITIIME